MKGVRQTYTLVNSVGGEVRRGTLEPGLNQIEAASLAPGVYYLYTKGHTHALRMVKE